MVSLIQLNKCDIITVHVTDLTNKEELVLTYEWNEVTQQSAQDNICEHHLLNAIYHPEMGVDNCVCVCVFNTKKESERVGESVCVCV